MTEIDPKWVDFTQFRKYAGLFSPKPPPHATVLSGRYALSAVTAVNDVNALVLYPLT